VEKKTPGGDWEKVSEVPILGENCMIPDLEEGKEYEFRVAAVTDAGVGDPSLNTSPVLIKDKKGLSVDAIVAYCTYERTFKRTRKIIIGLCVM
jgi:predicted RNA-binding protein with TRAM domain